MITYSALDNKYIHIKRKFALKHGFSFSDEIDFLFIIFYLIKKMGV